MKRKSTEIVLATVIMSIAIVATAYTESFGQTFRIEHQGKTGHAFTTNEGTISALHVGGVNFDYYYPALDLMIDTRTKSDQGFKTSDLPPSYFIDRRGTRHSLAKTGSHHSQTVVSMRFFPGESGMPIFAADGSVCCVVLGNAFINARWRGRVARIHPLLEGIQAKKVLADPK